MRDLYALGDIHEDWESALMLLPFNSIVILCGDCGVGFRNKYRPAIEQFIKEKEKLKRINKKLSEMNTILYCIRGNHDNPEYFKGDFIYSNLKLIPDYTVLEIENIKILCVGGATSIDSHLRTIGSDYWEDEVFVLDEEKVSKMRDIDIVCSHTCHETSKLYIPKTFSNANYFVGGMEEKLNEEKLLYLKFMNLLFQNNNIKAVYHGHFHKSWDTDIYHSLNIMELRQIEI